MTQERSLAAALRVLLGVAVVASIGVAVASQVSSLPDVDWTLSPEWVAPAFLLLVAFQWAHAEVWRVVLRELGTPIAPRPSRAIWSISLLARYVPTSLLMPITRVLMAEKEGVPRRVGAASMAYEFALTFASSVVLGAYGVLALPQLEGEAWRWAVLVVPVLTLGAMHPRVFVPVADAVLRRLKRPPLGCALPFAQVLRFTLLYGLGFLLAGAAVVCFAETLHPLQAGDVPVLLVAYPVGFAFSLVAFVVPGGLGTREAALAAVAALALPLGVAVAVAVGIRLLQIVVELLYGAAAPWLAARAQARG
jgi:hypothetical protein